MTIYLKPWSVWRKFATMPIWFRVRCGIAHSDWFFGFAEFSVRPQPAAEAPKTDNLGVVIDGE